MKLLEAEKKLDDTLETFKEEMKIIIDYSSDKSDIEDMTKEIYYCLSDFKKILIEYLKGLK